MATTTTARMQQIALDLIDSGQYVSGMAVDQITDQRDNLLDVLHIVRTYVSPALQPSIYAMIDEAIAKAVNP